MEIENLVDKKIIETVLNKLNINYSNHKYFTDGASSRVILLNNQYLIKQNSKLALQAEVTFLTHNKSEMFQKLIYVDPNFEFVVYSFITGNVMKKVENPLSTFKKLIEIVSTYPDFSGNEFGYLDEPTISWSDFLNQEINHSSSNLSSIPINSEFAYSQIHILEQYPFSKKLLHGDFGTHNFIEENNSLKGIIDPMTIAGDPLYDLLFAFVSNTDFVLNISLEKLYSLIDEPIEKINSLLIIVLYSRFSRCLKYHPKDIDVYLNLWNKLINYKN